MKIVKYEEGEVSPRLENIEAKLKREELSSMKRAKLALGSKTLKLS